MTPWSLIIIGLVVIAMGTAITSYGWHLLSVNKNNTIELTETITKESATTRMHMDEALKQIIQPPSEINEKYPGYSSHMVVTLYRQEDKRRKYIIDIGEKNGERFSAFFDPSNIFTLSIQDSNGEPHILKVPSGDTGILINQWIVLSFEYGTRENSTFLNVYVNGNSIRSLDMPFKIDIAQIQIKNIVLAADIDGVNNAKMKVAEIANYSSTFTTSELEQIVTYFEEEVIRKITNAETE